MHRASERWAGGLTLLAVFALALVPAGAGAAVPRLLQEQIGDLSPGVAILQYDRRKVTRAALLRRARRLGADARGFRRLRMIAVRGTRTELRRAARLRGVRAAHMNRSLRYFLHESVPLIYGGTQGSAWSSGADGRGVRVAVVDSGIDGLHPDLRARTVRNVKVLANLGDFFTGAPGSPVTVTCPGPCNTDTTGGHGTHVAGIVAGDGTASDGYHRGVAPGADLVGISAGDGPAILWNLAAFDYILAHPELGIRVVNNSWGRTGGENRYDSTDPINQATKQLHDSGITVVFSGGNAGTGSRQDPEGASDCSTRATSTGREPTEGQCQMNVYSVAPWVMATAMTRKDRPGGPGAQPINLGSSRGDPVPQLSLDGRTISYRPTLAAPGVNIWSARDAHGVTGLTCGASAEAPACVPAKPQYALHYVPVTGTSMAAPHVAGAVAVLQSAARAKLRRDLTPAEVRTVLTRTAAPMTLDDGLWDFPCGQLFLPACGTKVGGTTGRPYETWQVGAGALDLKAALAGFTSLVPRKLPRR